MLALCINTDGFIRYSAILEAGTADPKSLPAMEDLSHGQKPSERGGAHACGHPGAGIASEANLTLLKDKGYNHLCVSRTRLKDYELAPDCRTVTVHDARKQAISLREVCTEPDGDYYLEVTSPSKAMTEASMHRQWRSATVGSKPYQQERFEEELEKANASIGKKGGTKKYEKVIERVARAQGKYPSICKFTVNAPPPHIRGNGRLYQQLGLARL